MNDQKDNPFVISITGTNGKTTVAKIIYEVLIANDFKVCLLSSMGVFINGKLIADKDRTGPDSHELIKDRLNDFDFIISENVLKHINEGHFFPIKSDICLITNISDDHKHQTQSNTIEEIAGIKSRLIKQNKLEGVVILNADSPYTEVIINEQNENITNLNTFSITTNDLDIASRKYIFKDNNIYKIEDKVEELLVRNVTNLPITLNGQLKFNIENIIASVTILDNINKDINLQESLEKLKLDYSTFPGRFNIIDFNNFKVILDKAHNPESYKNIFEIIKSFDKKRTVSLIKVSSTRSNDLLKEIVSLVAANSDFIYIKESFAKDSDKKVNLGGSIARKIENELRSIGFDLSNTKIILDELEATEYAIKNAQQGDLIVIFGYRIDDIYKKIISLKNEKSINI